MYKNIAVRSWVDSNTQTLYEGCLFYLGIRKEKQILITKNRYFIFQNILH